METKHFDTAFHHIEVTTAEDGRISIVLSKGTYPMHTPIVDIEIPSQEGEFKDAFKPTVKVAEGIEIEKLK